MYLQDALREFSIRRIKTIAFPETIALKKACARFKAVESVSKELNAERTQRLLAAFNEGRADQLHRRDIRFITLAIGNDKLQTSAEVKPILDEVERRNDPRLFRAAFAALLAIYRHEGLRQIVTWFLKRHLDNLRKDTRTFIEQSGILETQNKLQTFAARLACSKDIYAFCLINCINNHILVSNYGTELKLAVIREVVKYADEGSLKNVFNWVFEGVSGTPIGDYYEAMLSPFFSKTPQEGAQRILINWVVEKFKDPRIHIWPVPLGRDGEARRQACVATLKRWLSIEYLDLFIKIIESTAVDRQFKPRKQFWLKYFEKDKISDVTLILASDADKIAHKMRAQSDNTNYMQWAKLGSASSDQSVLLMRLGDLIIAEWSHNGAIRFWKSTDKHAPQFHLPEYVGSQLRDGSMKIKVGNTQRDSIIHHENGDWMQWAAGAIKYFTNVTM
jgi:EH_Signature domain